MATAVGEGLCTILTSDYYYPSLVQAVFRLVARGLCSFADGWAMVSGTPAAAAGLHDRGAITVGRRADLVVVDDRDPELPQVVATMVGGRMVYEAGGALRRTGALNRHGRARLRARQRGS